MFSVSKYCLVAGLMAGISAGSVSAHDSRACDPNKIARWVHILQFDRDGDHREDAAEDLGKYADPSVIPLLAHAAAYDRDKDVRKEAGKAIARIQSRFPQGCRPGPVVQYMPQPAV